MKLLAFSYAFPPLAFPRSIQIARLLSHLDHDITVVCSDDAAARRDESIPFHPKINVIRIPFDGGRYRLGRLADKIHLSWHVPDAEYAWVKSAAQTVEALPKSDCLVTFGQPMSDHLLGLDIKKRTGIPWIAHFSDPWIDNPYRRDNPISRAINRRMEHDVIAAADAVIFTSPETTDLVMKKYPSSWRSKAFDLPHATDPSLYPDENPPDHPYTIRHIGNLYGRRSPEALIRAVRRVSTEDARIEFVGNPGHFSGIVSATGSVGYLESLRLMRTSHCLLIIDAVGEFSVFFPSKLADYIGANRHILAITPPGTAARIVHEVGGTVANPNDPEAVEAALRHVIAAHPSRLPTSTNHYAIPVVADRMMEIIRHAVG